MQVWGRAWGVCIWRQSDALYAGEKVALCTTRQAVRVGVQRPSSILTVTGWQEMERPFHDPSAIMGGHT